MTAQGRMLPWCVVAAALVALTPAPARAASDDAAIRAAIAHAGLLADPMAGSDHEVVSGSLHVTPHLASGAPVLTLEHVSENETRVRIERWITGTLAIDANGHHFTKPVRDSAVREVTLHRTSDSGWRITELSAQVALTPNGHADLSLASIDSRSGSTGYLSVLSDLDELAVRPQTCAMALPGDSVRVFVGGVEPDAVVMVFADGQRVLATSDGGSHFEARLALSHTGLANLGVTVYPRRSLSDPRANAESRTWVLPVLVADRRPALADLAFTF